MGQPHAMGTMADPDELVGAMKALGTVDRIFTQEQAAAAERHAGGKVLWQLECAQHLAGAVEAQVLMAGGAAVAAGHDFKSIAQAGWELYAGASMQEDSARIGLLVALSGRLVDQVMMMVARKRRGDGDELLSPLVMPTLLVAQALQTLLRAAATETLGDDREPRSGLMEVVNQLSGAAEILESMTPRQFRES